MTNEAAWNVTPHSDTRMNRMTNIPNTGAVLAGLDKTKHGIFICTADGGGLLKDHVYLCNAAGDALIDLSAGAAHTHSSATDGGTLINIAKANPKSLDLLLMKTTDIVKASWVQTTTSTGSISDSGTTERSITLSTGATSGASATIAYPAMDIDFGQDAMFQAKVQISSASSLALHVGVNADDITSADTNNRKFQAEVCTATNNNWFLRTANGSANSSSDTGIAISTNRVAIKIIHMPTLGTPEADLYIDSGTVLQKTSNIATSGNNSGGYLLKSSIKNSTAADRPLLNYMFRLRYNAATNWV